MRNICTQHNVLHILEGMQGLHTAVCVSIEAALESVKLYAIRVQFSPEPVLMCNTVFQIIVQMCVKIYIRLRALHNKH